MFFPPYLMLELVFTILVENSSFRKNLIFSYITSSEVPSKLAGNSYDPLFMQREHHH